MRLTYPEIEAMFEWPATGVPVLIIENQTLFRRMLTDIRLATEGVEAAAILSESDRPVSMARHVVLISDFLHFELNQKSLLNKVCAALEQAALSDEQYLATQTLLTNIETAVEDWAFRFPCDIVVSKLTVTSLLKAVGIVLREEYEGERGEMEKVLDYMELVREFDGEKLFITVNMRDWFSDEIVEAFMKTVMAHEYKVLMIESCAHSRLEEEQRVTIDRDLCEF